MTHTRHAGGTRTIRLRAFRESDTEAAVELWEACGLTRPWNDPRADIARSLSAQPELFLVAECEPAATAGPGSGSSAGAGICDGTTLVGTVMAGFDGHRGWMYYLATAQALRGSGIGRALVAEVERRLEALGCPKAQLMVRSENSAAVGFYTALGYEANDVIVLGKRLINDAP